jgi:hypothetical protein
VCSSTVMTCGAPLPCGFSMELLKGACPSVTARWSQAHACVFPVSLHTRIDSATHESAIYAQIPGGRCSSASAWGFGKVRGTPFCATRATRRRKSTAATRSIVCQEARKLLLSSDNDHILSTCDPACVSILARHPASMQPARICDRTHPTALGKPYP